MLRLHQLSLGLDEAQRFDEAMLRRLCAQRLGVEEGRIVRAEVVKRSVDARKGAVRFALTADVELRDGGDERIAKRFRPNEVAVVAARSAAEADVFGLALPPWPAQAARPLGQPASLISTLALLGAGSLLLLSLDQKALPAQRPGGQ